MKNKIIYILGAGRSGTTLVDIILGNSDDIFSCGELVRFPELRGIPHGFSSKSDNYMFWKSIEKKIFSVLKESYKELSKLSKKIEFHLTFFLILFRLVSPLSLKKYRKYVNTLFRALFDSINESIVIDSSKYAGRGLGLLRYLEYELYIIYVQRDPVKVVEAFKKQGLEQEKKCFLIANIYYLLVNFICRIVFFKTKKSHRYLLKYENFISNTEEELKNIQKHFNISLEGPIQLAKQNNKFKVGLLFEGNRIRLKKYIYLNKALSPHSNKKKAILTRLINIAVWRRG